MFCNFLSIITTILWTPVYSTRNIYKCTQPAIGLGWVGRRPIYKATILSDIRLYCACAPFILRMRTAGSGSAPSHNITNGHVTTILQLVVQQVRWWLASNGQNFATSQHLDMSRCWDVVLTLTK